MLIQQASSPAKTPVATEHSAPVVPVNPGVATEKQTQVVEAKDKASAEQAPDSAQLKNAVDQINKTIQSLANNLQFSMEKIQGMQVVKVVDNETQQVIRQIPTEEMLDIAKRLDELQGLLIRQKA